MNEFDFQPLYSSTFDTSIDDVKVDVETVNDFLLSDEMILNAVHRACDFFGVPEVPVVNADGVCVWTNNPTTYTDDVLGFNRNQLMQLGISCEDSLTLIYTHECAHRTFQGVYNDSWEEELACDFFAGIHAGLKGINLDNFEESLGMTNGSNSHPCGTLRIEFVEYGQKIAQEMQDRNIEVTYDRCIEYLNDYIKDKGSLIAEYRLLANPNSFELADDKTSSSVNMVKGISFTGKYSDAEIDKMKHDVDIARSEMVARKNDVDNWKTKVSLNDTKEHHANGDYENTVRHLNDAKNRYNYAVDRYNSALSKLTTI